MILAGDIGGTHTRLAYFEVDHDAPVIAKLEVYPSRRYPSLAAIVEEFLGDDTRSIERAAFGVAGPVSDGRAKVSTLDWQVDSGRLASVLGVDRVLLANDMEVNA